MKTTEIPLITDLKEASRSIGRITILQRDLTLLNAELKAIIQAKRVACALTGLIFLQMAVGLGLLWVGVILYRAGFSPGSIALFSIFVPGAAAAVFFFFADQIGKSNEAYRPHPTDQRPEEARARVRA